MMFISAISSCLKAFVLEERARGLTQIRVVPWRRTQAHYLAFDEPAYRADLNVNLQFDTTTMRFEYTSMKTPLSIYDYDMATRQKNIAQTRGSARRLRSGPLRTERLFAAAPDGTEIPISLLYKKGTVETATIRFCSTATALTASASMRRSRRRA